jgi:thiol-disulfide isomerase/thioredoxin
VDVKNVPPIFENICRCFDGFDKFVKKRKCTKFRMMFIVMKRVILKFLVVWSLLFLISISLAAQKRFSLIVNLPPGIHNERVEAWLEDGRQSHRIKANPTGQRQVTLTGEYVFLYAAITLQYAADSSNGDFSNTFFVQQKPSVITFHQSDSVNFPFIKYSLENVIDFKEEKNQIKEYAVLERKKAMDYEARYGDQIFNGHDTAIRNYYFRVLMKALGNKELEYIMKNPTSYYSFYSFRSDVVQRGILSPDSLLIAFNAFPDKFKYSDEGNYLHEFIIGRLSYKNKDVPIDFKAKDIGKKNITLSNFKGQKYVLLHFWATWCTPCIRELPALNEINNRYKSKDLQIISIALKSSDYANYIGTIKKYRMDWIHIYNDLDLLNKYGNMPVPRISLIDKNGKLVYDNVGLGKDDDFQLKELTQILQGTIN